MSSKAAGSTAKKASVHSSGSNKKLRQSGDGAQNKENDSTCVQESGASSTQPGLRKREHAHAMNPARTTPPSRSPSVKRPQQRRRGRLCLCFLVLLFVVGVALFPIEQVEDPEASAAPEATLLPPDTGREEDPTIEKADGSAESAQGADGSPRVANGSILSISGSSSRPDQCSNLEDKAWKSSLKVYVYDLPRKFNFGLFQHHTLKEGDGENSTQQGLEDKPWGFFSSEQGTAPPPWPWSGRTHPTAKQHSMEYFIVADLLLPPQMRHPNTTAVRVENPEDADVFLVPVFSSLIVNIHRRRHYKQHEQLAMELASFLSESSWWRRSAGRDHVIPVHHPCALETVRDWMSGAIFVVVDFARFHPTTANPDKDVVHPYNQLVPQYSQQSEESLSAAGAASDSAHASPFSVRKTLLFFQGSLAGRPRRKYIIEAMMGHSDVHVQDVKASLESIKETQAGMRSSKFCLHVVGDTPSASRLFSAIVSACVPVIISDGLDLPFESSINYGHFALFFEEKDAMRKGFVVQKLRMVNEEQWMRMWNKLRQVQHHFLFQVPSVPGDAVDMMWREVRLKLPRVHLSMHRDRRLTVPDWWDHEYFMEPMLRRQANRKKNRTRKAIKQVTASWR